MLYNTNYGKKINTKSLIIGTVIVICIILATIMIYIYFKQNKKETYTTLNSTDEKFSIQIPDSINYRINSATNNDFTLDLFSQEDELFMYATTIEKNRDLDLLQVATDDKTSYFNDKENIRDDTGIYETQIDNNKALEYSLVYYDTQYEKDFYCDVLWVEKDNYIFVFNFEVSNSNADKYKDIYNKMKNSIVFN